MRSRQVGALSAAVLALLHSSTHAQDGPVSPKEIQETWVGAELTGTTASGASASLKLGRDGTAAVSAGNTRDAGTWRASETGYCTTWNTIRAGQERCFTLVRD